MTATTGLPMALVSFCENLGTAVTTAGNQNGWRVQQFGRRGFNADVTVGRSSLKITTGGTPGPDGAGAAIRFSRPGHDRVLTIRVNKDGELEMAEASGATVPLSRFVELVGEGCDSPLKVATEVPATLSRFCEKIGSAVVSTGNDKGWAVTPFGSKGFSSDVTVGNTILKVTTEGKWAADGSGAVVKLKRSGFERAFVTRVARDGNLELADDGGKPVSHHDLLEHIAQGCGTTLKEADALPSQLHRLYEVLASTVAKSGQDIGWKVQRFGSRGFNADVAVGPNIVKITTDSNTAPDGSGATVFIKKAGASVNEGHKFTTRVAKDGELELVDAKSALCDLHRFIELLADACGTPLKEEGDLPAPLVGLCEKIANTVVNAGNDNGWKVKQFGSKGVNCDVAVGPNIAKLTTQGKPAADGTGVTIRIARGAFERSLTVRAAKDGSLELADDGGKTAGMQRLIELIGEACGAPVEVAEALPSTLQRLCEKIASAVGTYGHGNGLTVRPFGSTGYNATLAVGNNMIKVTTEGKPAADGSGAAIRIKRPGFDRGFVSQMGREGELVLADDKGTAIPLEKFVDALREGCKF